MTLFGGMIREHGVQGKIWRVVKGIYESSRNAGLER